MRGLVLEPKALIAKQTKSLKLHATIILQFRNNPLEKLHPHCAALSSTICICCPGSAFICILVSWGSHPYIWLVTRLFEGWARKIRKLAFWERNAVSSLSTTRLRKFVALHSGWFSLKFESRLVSECNLAEVCITQPDQTLFLFKSIWTRPQGF